MSYEEEDTDTSSPIERTTSEHPSEQEEDTCHMRRRIQVLAHRSKEQHQNIQVSRSINANARALRSWGGRGPRVLVAAVALHVLVAAVVVHVRVHLVVRRRKAFLKLLVYPCLSYEEEDTCISYEEENTSI
jgi:hypothetical protein